MTSVTDNTPSKHKTRHAVLPCAFKPGKGILQQLFSSKPIPRQNRIAILKERIWPLPAGQDRRVLRVKFGDFDGAAASHALIRRILQAAMGDPIAQTLAQNEANTLYTFTPYLGHPGEEGPHIRVAFSPKGRFSSQHGTAALDVPADEPTMVLGFEADDLTPEYDDWFQGMVRHEFGHALGAVHEHQSPVFPYHWNRQAVIDYY